MIEIKNLKKQFHNETEIAYRDMTFESGRSYMLLGASGCGKSTLLNLSRVYPMEILILASVFLISLLPTAISTYTMSRKDGIGE